jgi:hypothetical protein
MDKTRIGNLIIDGPSSAVASFAVSDYRRSELVDFM